MSDQNLSTNTLCELVRKCLRSFSKFEERHSVKAVQIDDRKVWVGYRTTEANIPSGTTHFDLNLIDNICYILWIELSEQERGGGFGRQLYSVIEDIARDVGCDRVRLAPSGKTTSGKTRLEYMQALGYRVVGDEVEKLV